VSDGLAANKVIQRSVGSDNNNFVAQAALRWKGARSIIEPGGHQRTRQKGKPVEYLLGVPHTTNTPATLRDMSV